MNFAGLESSEVDKKKYCSYVLLNIMPQTIAVLKSIKEIKNMKYHWQY